MKTLVTFVLAWVISMPLQDPSFEAGIGTSPWDLNGASFWTSSPPAPFDGVQAIRLTTSGGPPVFNEANVVQEYDVTPGVRRRTKVYASKQNQVGPFVGLLAAEYNEGSGWVRIGDISHDDLPDWNDLLPWKEVDFGTYTPTVGTIQLRFINLDNGSAPGFYISRVYFDLASDELDPETVMALSTIKDFMTKLKDDVLTPLDANLGSVFTTTKRWVKLSDAQGDITFSIGAAGLWDDIGRIGNNVSRFWSMEPRIVPRHLTNNSLEFENVVTLTGFFQREEDDTQEAAMCEACRQILGTLTEKDTELTTLSTGPGYMGYLETLPYMVLPVSSARLDDSGMLGHVAQIEIRYYEEISRS